MQTAVRTVGIEEELLLVDLAADRAAPLGELLVAESATAETVALEHEFKQEQIEIGSEPSHTLGELVTQLTRLRADAAAAATGHDSRIVAIATSPWKGRPNATVDARYDSMSREFGLLAPPTADLRAARPRRHRVARRGGRGTGPHPAVVVGAHGRVGEFPVLAGAGHRLRQLPQHAVGTVADRRTDRGVRRRGRL